MVVECDKLLWFLLVCNWSMCCQRAVLLYILKGLQQMGQGVEA